MVGWGGWEKVKDEEGEELLFFRGVGEGDGGWWGEWRGCGFGGGWGGGCCWGCWGGKGEGGVGG